MPGVDGGMLRTWQRSRGWDVPALARQMRRAAGSDPLPVHDALVRMIWRWEREGLRTERYELLYRALRFDDASAAAPREVGDPGDLGAEDEARDVMAWITGTNASDDAIEEMARAAAYLAEVHTQIAPRKILPEVIGVHHHPEGIALGLSPAGALSPALAAAQAATRTATGTNRPHRGSRVGVDAAPDDLLQHGRAAGHARDRRAG
jgi:hypothetical protein